MTDTPTPTPSQEPAPTTAHKEQDWGKIGIWIAVAAAVIVLLWLAFALREANRHGKELGAERGATAFAAAVLPLLDLRSKNQIIDDEALQRVCEDMVSGNGFEFAAITDNSGNVIAASDVKFKGKVYPGINTKAVNETEKDGVVEVSRPVARGNVPFGAVVVRSK